MRAVLVSAALLAAACTGTPAQAEHPALIVNANGDSRADLLSAVRAALNNAPLLLADDALTQENVLLIERRQRFDTNGLPVNGRERDMPERFLLSTDGKRCVLTQERTQQRWVLSRTQCKARD